MPPRLTRVTRFGLVNAFLVRGDDGLTLVTGSAKLISAGRRERARPDGRAFRR
jgi:hypothetical protein